MSGKQCSVISRDDTVKGFDNMAVNRGLLMGLPFAEATGVITHDVAKPHHDPVTLVGPPTWEAIGSRLGVLSLNGVTDYLEAAAADTLDLDFTAGNYSVAGWIYQEASAQSKLLIGRYAVDTNGWEIYTNDGAGIGYLEMRHHHFSLAPDLRDGLSSVGWFLNQWNFVTITRNGVYPLVYRDAVAIPVTYDPLAGLSDPDSSNSDLVIGARFSKDANFFAGKMWNWRIWNRELGSDEVKFLYNTERHWFQ